MTDDPKSDEAVVYRFDDLLRHLRSEKPNDRSEKDRYWAIVITEVEKAQALFVHRARSED